MKCIECNGKGFIEYNAGLLRVKCEICNGTGDVNETEGLELGDILTEELIVEAHGVITEEDNLTFPMLETAVGIAAPLPMSTDDLKSIIQDGYILPESVDTIKIPDGLKGVVDDSNTGANGNNKITGSGDASGHQQSSKPKARGRAKNKTK